MDFETEGLGLASLLKNARTMEKMESLRDMVHPLVTWPTDLLAASNREKYGPLHPEVEIIIIRDPDIFKFVLRMRLEDYYDQGAGKMSPDLYKVAHTMTPREVQENPHLASVIGAMFAAIVKAQAEGGGHILTDVGYLRHQELEAARIHTFSEVLQIFNGGRR